jgi:Calcineurin-like phosphoesterase
MSTVARWLAILLLLADSTAQAADLPGPWVEFASDGGLDVRSIVAPGMDCPKVTADGAVLTSTTRGKPDGDYPVQVCVAHATAATRGITVDGLPAPVLASDIKRIVVIGDTGCRLKGSFTQDCNDPVKWPFAVVARLAAAHHPDLIIHVGDYHYRESPCPAGQPGCAGSPYGDNWAVWQKDFFDPATPLLAAAPWVLVRGNHELCSRGGHGWFRLLDPHPDADKCTATTSPYALRIGALNLLLFDGADADDATADPTKVTLCREQLQTLLANAPSHAWLLTHRPVWALAQGQGVTPGAALNATEQAAIRDLVPAELDMVLSGHVHDFTSYEFGPARPAQLVIGEGGDANDAIAQPVNQGIDIDGVKIHRALAIPDYGYVVLHRVSQGWTGTVYALTDQVLARCRLHGRDVSCRSTTR